MPENEQVVTPTPSTDQNYIEVIKDLKNNTVSKAEYERVVNENRTLAEAFATSAPASAETVQEPTYTQADIDDIATKMSKGHMSNLEFINNALKYRDAVLAVHGEDPFLPHNSGYVPDEADAEKANAIAEGLKQMAEYAGGDSKLFNSELKRNCK